MSRKSTDDMLLINMMCMPLYNDLATVVYNLYENKDDRSPFELFLISVDEDKIMVFSPSDREGIDIGNSKPQSYWKWVQRYPVFDKTNRSGFRFEPSVTSCRKRVFGKQLSYIFFEKLIKVKGMKLLDSWTVGSVHVVVYKDELFARDVLPKQIDDACFLVSSVWRDFFNSGLHIMQPPQIDKKEIIKDLLVHSFKSDDNSQNIIKEISLNIEIVTRISSIFYETKRSNGNITVIKNKPRTSLLQFKEEDGFNSLSFSIKHAKQLRKLLETAKDDLSLLVHNQEVYGIGRTNPARKVKSSNRKYTFCLTGHMEWHVDDANDRQLLRYKHGEYYLPELKEIRDWYIDSRIKDTVVSKIARDILAQQANGAFNNGAIIIITSNAKEEAARLCKLKRGLQTSAMSISNPNAEAKTLFDIDGAVLLDENGLCHGIGIILDGEACVDGSPARGARYNSSKTYITRCVKHRITAYALVLSTDGYFDIITSYDEEFKGVKKIHKAILKKKGKTPNETNTP